MLWTLLAMGMYLDFIMVHVMESLSRVTSGRIAHTKYNVQFRMSLWWLHGGWTTKSRAGMKEKKEGCCHVGHVTDKGPQVVWTCLARCDK